ncbi:cytochrome c [Azospirillum sp.]|uniref:c-type cytochrome n=1 Tax=Azospirillum sp. TaxID=34012 RepID=UPI002D411648|nr:cytochrome c [Azospirillum sp.]HYD70792.1 cytochrome c [Azospirillum sp.]
MTARWIAALLLTLAAALPAWAAEPVLTIAIGGTERTFTRTALLARPDAVTVQIPHDVAYGRAMTYRAVPVGNLVSADQLPSDSVLEAVATDGFVAQLRADVVCSTDGNGAVAFVAVEPADAPWPNLPGKGASAGPFYMVWVNPAASGIRSEQWPYQMARLGSAESPAKRWPQLAVDASLPAADPVRAGQVLFVTQCMTCHTLNRAGSGSMGPDLNLPMNPTEYLQPHALKRLIRDSRSVRAWSGQQMPAFTEEMLSDREIDLILAYLRHMAGRKAE